MADHAPDYGTAPQGELESPRSPAWLVFTPYVSGSGALAAFAPEQWDEARAWAIRARGLLVKVAVVADHRESGE